MIPANVEWYKQFSQFRRDSKIKKCFREGYDECGESIVAAHSIQRNGVLDILESEISGKMAVLSFLDLEFNEKGEHVGFRTLGKKVASTFS